MDRKRVRIAAALALIVVLNVALVLVTHVRTGNWTLDWRATDYDTVRFQDRTYHRGDPMDLPAEAVPCGDIAKAPVFLDPMETCGEGTPTGIYLDNGGEIRGYSLAGGP